MPLAVILLTPGAAKIPATVGAVVAALLATGWASAVLGGARRVPPIARNVGGGLLAMTITYGIGSLVGTQI